MAQDSVLHFLIDPNLLSEIQRAAKKSGDPDTSTFVRRILSEKILMVADEAPATKADLFARAMRLISEGMEVMGQIGGMDEVTRKILDGLKGQGK